MSYKSLIINPVLHLLKLACLRRKPSFEETLRHPRKKSPNMLPSSIRRTSVREIITDLLKEKTLI